MTQPKVKHALILHTHFCTEPRLLHKCEQEVKAIADDETFQNYENNFDNLNDKKREREVVDQF